MMAETIWMVGITMNWFDGKYELREETTDLLDENMDCFVEIDIKREDTTSGS